MECVGVGWSLLKDLAINRLRLGQMAGLVMLSGKLKGLVNGELRRHRRRDYRNVSRQAKS